MNQIEKLQHLKSIILSIPENKINLGVWRESLGDSCKTTQEMIEAGISACILGWATADQKFNDLGFSFSRYVDWTSVPVYCPFQHKNYKEEYYPDDVDESLWFIEFSAAQEFFGLNEEQVEYLIGSNSYNTQRPSNIQVAERIDTLISQLEERASSFTRFFYQSYFSVKEISSIAINNQYKQARVTISCENPYLQADQQIQFVSYLVLPADQDVLAYISNTFSVGDQSKSRLSFVPETNNSLLADLKNNPIEQLHENWADKFKSPYINHFNRMLTYLTLEALSTIKVVLH